jgi:hypothetical protein
MPPSRNATVRLQNSPQKPVVSKLFSQHKCDYASQNMGLREAFSIFGALILVLLPQIMSQ